MCVVQWLLALLGYRLVRIGRPCPHPRIVHVPSGAVIKIEAE